MGMPVRRGFAPGFVNYKKGVLDSKPQVIKFTSYLAHVRWFSPGTPASSTTKTGRYDIAEILLKMALMHEYTITLYDYWTYMKYPGTLRLI
jgi:hypothetical protein